MAQSTSKKKTAGKMAMKNRLYEGFLILLACLTLYLMVSMVTYHVSDSAWSTTGSGEVIANAGGRVGAFLADIILSLLGCLGFALPLVILGVLVLLFRQHWQEKPSWPLALWSAGCLLFYIGGCSLLSLYTHSSDWSFNLGGILGQSVSLLLSSWLNRFGATLVLVTAWLIGLTLLCGISWMRLGNLGLQGFVSLLVSFFKKISTIKLPKFSLPQRQKLMMESAVTEEIFDPEEMQLTQEVFPNTIDSKPKAVENFSVPERLIQKTAKSTPDPKPTTVKKTKMTPGKLALLPSVNLLDDAVKNKKVGYTSMQLELLARNVEARLQEFGVVVKVVGSCVGPVVTRFELELAPGVKVSRITGLAKDLARALSTSSVRVVEVIPGKAVIGLEIPNESREMVKLKEILQSSAYEKADSFLSLALGKDIAGHSVVVDLAKMPHLLVAGTTGSGKSVSVNAMILSILLKARPEEVRMLMIDPKMLELSIYENIPHLLAPVVTDMKEAANVLRWCVAEMDRRYRVMAALSVRNLAGFNTKVRAAISAGKPLKDPLTPAHQMETAPLLEPLPQIVVVIDELADMMMVVGKKVEDLIARIAQKARAAGIHMILATQRPSVDVITGLIKANIPTRIAFQVSSRIDSRTILDQQGAEHLLGHGDMLYLPPGTSLPIRVHGAFVSDEEVLRVVAAWKEWGEPEYLEEITQDPEESSGGVDNSDAEQDPLYDQAVAVVIEERRASISLIQRRLKIGYNRAARMVEAMEQAGLVSGMDGNGSREVLAPRTGEH